MPRSASTDERASAGRKCYAGSIDGQAIVLASRALYPCCVYLRELVYSDLPAIVAVTASIASVTASATAIAATATIAATAIGVA